MEFKSAISSPGAVFIGHDICETAVNLDSFSSVSSSVTKKLKILKGIFILKLSELNYY